MRGNKVMRVGSGSALQSVYHSGCRYDLPQAVMAVLAQHMDLFTDVDGKDSLRITETGIAATTPRTR